MDQLASKELALKAKDIGFNEPCAYYYDVEHDVIKCDLIIGNGYGVEIDEFYFKYNTMYTDMISVPTLSQLQAWIRNKHDIHVMIGVYELNWWYQLCNLSIKGKLKENSYAGNDSYEKALENGLTRACEIINRRKK